MVILIIIIRKNGELVFKHKAEFGYYSTKEKSSGKIVSRLLKIYKKWIRVVFLSFTFF